MKTHQIFCAKKSQISKLMNLKTTLCFSLLFLSAIISYSQKITIGFTDSIQSEVLNENRKFLIKLPEGYLISDKSYPVLYRLDGNLDIFTRRDFF